MYYMPHLHEILKKANYSDKVNQRWPGAMVRKGYGVERGTPFQSEKYFTHFLEWSTLLLVVMVAQLYNLPTFTKLHT